MMHDDTPRGAASHLSDAAHALDEIRTLRQQIDGLLASRDSAIRAAHQAGMRIPAIARALGVSASLARFAAIGHNGLSRPEEKD